MRVHDYIDRKNKRRNMIKIGLEISELEEKLNEQKILQIKSVKEYKGSLTNDIYSDKIVEDLTEILEPDNTWFDREGGYTRRHDCVRPSQVSQLTGYITALKGTKLSEEAKWIIQRKYLILLENSKVERAREIRKITRIKPKLDKLDIKASFHNIINTFLQDHYSDITLSDVRNTIMLTEDFTKTNWKYTDKEILNATNNLISYTNCRMYDHRERWSNVPGEFSEKLEIKLNILNKMNKKKLSKLISDHSKINPYLKDSIESTYSNLILTHFSGWRWDDYHKYITEETKEVYENLNSIEKITGIKISPKKINKSYKKLINDKGELGRGIVESLEKHLKIKKKTRRRS